MITIEPMITQKRYMRGDQFTTEDFDPGIDRIRDNLGRLGHAHRKPMWPVVITVECSDSTIAEVMEALQARDERLLEASGKDVPDPFPERKILRGFIPEGKIHGIGKSG